MPHPKASRYHRYSALCHFRRRLFVLKSAPAVQIHNAANHYFCKLIKRQYCLLTIVCCPSLLGVFLYNSLAPQQSFISLLNQIKGHFDDTFTVRTKWRHCMTGDAIVLAHLIHHFAHELAARIGNDFSGHICIGPLPCLDLQAVAMAVFFLILHCIIEAG